MSLRNPVQHPVRYYSHLDAQAPQLSDTDGAIKTIIKACLITGYGTKASAGWTELFEDEFRIVLRRPLRTGNPPDIKIENGVIDGVASHRIVSQDNPTGLNDPVELASVNLLARDSRKGTEWHLVVSDFGFVLCYQMGEDRTGDRNHTMYVGGLQKTITANPEIFVATSSAKINRDGKSAVLIAGILRDQDNIIKDMRSGTTYAKHNFVNYDKPETYFDNDYTAQLISIDLVGLYPFWCSIFSQYEDLQTKTISIDGRPALRYVNKHTRGFLPKSFYIPLDYWEL